MSEKTVYFETLGCQMNVLDSELVLGRLRDMGYRPVERLADAGLVLINTCSVRQHAEDKVYSRLGEVGRLKRRRPELIVGVIGCMAPRDGDGIMKRAPFVDLLCGPSELNKVPALVASAAESRRRALAVGTEMSRRLPVLERSRDFDSLEALDLSRSFERGRRVHQAYIRVQRGCDKFCTFCVVPFTRGRERCRPPEHIVREARMLADHGAREVTLLGQTINSYAYRENGRAVRFADLLERVSAVGGLDRLRFVTSYPGDFTDDILYALRDLPKVCEYLHLPAQSGSDAVLRRMKRQYTVERYDGLVAKARDIVPDISLAGDFIVGFSGETEEDFRRSVELIQRTRYKTIFCFKYSPRPGTAAERNLPDDVPEAVKRRRNIELLKVQERISLEANQRMVGRDVEVLVEGPSKAASKAGRNGGSAGPAANQLVGRTRGDQIVVFEGPASLAGQLLTVRIAGATPLTLMGHLPTLPTDVQRPSDAPLTVLTNPGR